METNTAEQNQSRILCEEKTPNLMDSQSPPNEEINLSESLICSENIEIIDVVRMEQFCRICASVRHLTELVHIFEKEGTEFDLQNKITTHLKLKITKEDQLPLQVCRTCIAHLNICHRLFEVSQTADRKLRQLFPPLQVPEHNDKGTLPPVNSVSDLGVSDDCKVDVPLNGTVVEKESRSAEPLLCDICGKSFRRASHLRVHKRTHLDDSVKKQHHCPICSKSFRSKFHLSEHSNVHNGVTPYSCADCGKMFHKRAQLRQHSQTHNLDSKKAVCEVCGLLFNRKSNLRAHEKTHAEGRTFSCKLCHSQFPSFSELLSHRNQHSQDDIKNLVSSGVFKDKDGLFTCEVCGKILTNRDSMVNHVALHKQRRSLQCPDCGKELRSQRTLHYHRRSQHTGERRFLCSFCSEGFMTKKLQLAHERRHTGEKPFTCGVCCKGFRSRNNLVQHMLKHNGVKNFKCSFCDKTFFRKGALTVHNRKHTGEKPFVCDLCGRPFTQKNDMLKHQKTHVEVNTCVYTCELCFAVFNTTSELASHKDHVHQANGDLVPLIITNNLFETLIITEDGQKIVVATEAVDDSPLLTPSTSVTSQLQ